jgi:hypothetical protein
MALISMTFVALDRFAVWCDECRAEIPNSAVDDLDSLRSVIRMHCRDQHVIGMGIFKRFQATDDPSEVRVTFVGSRLPISESDPAVWQKGPRFGSLRVDFDANGITGSTLDGDSS